MTLESVQQTLTTLTVKVESAQKETRRWQVIALLIPVIATAALGIIGDKWKSSLQATIDQRSKELSTRLALTEEFYKRKLNVHEALYKQLVVVVNALKDAKFNTDKRAEAVNSLAALYAGYTTGGLYLSRDLVSLLKEFEETATTTPVLYSNGTATIADLQDLFVKTEQQMVKDLQLSEIGSLH